MQDTVFNAAMRPVFSGEPSEVRRRLRSPYPEGWEKICIGETGVIVTIPQYLYAETYESVVQTLTEIARRGGLPMYQRDTARLETYIQRTAHVLIKRVLEGEKK